MPPPRDYIRLLLEGKAPPAPVMKLVGFSLKSAEPGRAVMEFEADERHHNPGGTLHGGVLCDVADGAMGFAFASTLKEGENFTTVELKINFLKAVKEGKLKAEGRVVKRGKTLSYIEADVTDEEGALIAKASSTVMVLPGGSR
ncbi:MAG: PaaI family thioesterase [Halobacteria archaeon]